MSSNSVELSVIIPAYNESGSIGRTLDAVRSYLVGRNQAWEIIVSADGTDGTREAAAAWAGNDPRVKVIGTPARGGKGKGIRNGVAVATGRLIGFVDADYKTPIEELDKLLPWFDDGYDIVFGSRAMDESQIERAQKLYRRIGSKAFAKVMRVMTGLYGVADTQCGFKFFRRGVAKDLFAVQRIDGYMFDVEILRLAVAKRYRMKEVGVRWQDDGDSRFSPVRGGWRVARELLKIRSMKYDPATLKPAASAFPANPGDTASPGKPA